MALTEAVKVLGHGTLDPGPWTLEGLERFIVMQATAVPADFVDLFCLPHVCA